MIVLPNLWEHTHMQAYTHTKVISVPKLRDIKHKKELMNVLINVWISLVYILNSFSHLVSTPYPPSLMSPLLFTICPIILTPTDLHDKSIHSLLRFFLLCFQSLIYPHPFCHFTPILLFDSFCYVQIGKLDLPLRRAGAGELLSLVGAV